MSEPSVYKYEIQKLLFSEKLISESTLNVGHSQQAFAFLIVGWPQTGAGTGLGTIPIPWFASNTVVSWHTCITDSSA